MATFDQVATQDHFDFDCPACSHGVHVEVTGRPSYVLTKAETTTCADASDFRIAPITDDDLRQAEALCQQTGNPLGQLVCPKCQRTFVFFALEGTEQCPHCDECVTFKIGLA